MTGPGPGNSLTYHASGVDYDALDAFKRACQREGASTRDALARHGIAEPAAIRGESAYLIETPDAYLAHVEEALGTKIRVADAVYALTGKSYYRNVAIDNVATIVNDLCSCGALPMTCAMYLATGDAEYLRDERRAADLAAGFAEGCRLAGAVWGGGETQVLRDMVRDDTAVLGGSAIGRIAPKSLRVKGDAEPGDAIVLLASSGVQTNGLTLCRKLVDRLPQGYLTPLRDARTYGEALLDASVIYVKFVAECQQRGIPLRYLVHMTGHGWRKLMRLEAPLSYEIDRLPEPQPVFELIVDAAKLDPSEAYGTFNMGVGFAAIVRPGDADATIAAAKSAGYDAWLGGTVRDGNGSKRVVLKPLDLTYSGDELKIR